jgi:hypothetical protein
LWVWSGGEHSLNLEKISGERTRATSYWARVRAFLKWTVKLTVHRSGHWGLFSFFVSFVYPFSVNLVSILKGTSASLLDNFLLVYDNHGNTILLGSGPLKASINLWIVVSCLYFCNAHRTLRVMLLFMNTAQANSPRKMTAWPKIPIGNIVSPFEYISFWNWFIWVSCPMNASPECNWLSFYSFYIRLRKANNK